MLSMVALCGSSGVTARWTALPTRLEVFTVWLFRALAAVTWNPRDAQVVSYIFENQRQFFIT